MVAAERSADALAVAAVTWDLQAAASVAGLCGAVEDGGYLIKAVEVPEATFITGWRRRW
jgi:hypothetical protein